MLYVCIRNFRPNIWALRNKGTQNIIYKNYSSLYNFVTAVCVVKNTND